MSKDSTVSPPARIRVAQGLALIALAASLVGALGQAERVRTTYSWPPSDLPAENPERAWYTPLLLVAHRPDAIDAMVPCALAPALPDAGTPTTVLATAHFPERVGGLAVTLERGRLEVSVGDRVLDRVAVRTALDGNECAYRLRASNGSWTLE